MFANNSTGITHRPFFVAFDSLLPFDHHNSHSLSNIQIYKRQWWCYLLMGSCFRYQTNVGESLLFAFLGSATLEGLSLFYYSGNQFMQPWQRKRPTMCLIKSTQTHPKKKKSQNAIPQSVETYTCPDSGNSSPHSNGIDRENLTRANLSLPSSYPTVFIIFSYLDLP